MSECQLLSGLCLVVTGVYHNLTTVSIDARRCVDSDHVIADNLEVGDFLATGEFNLSNGIKT